MKLKTIGTIEVVAVLMNTGPGQCHVNVAPVLWSVNEPGYFQIVRFTTIYGYTNENMHEKMVDVYINIKK